MIELLLQAERALAMGLVDQAERLYRQAADADPRNSIAVVGLARVALERSDDAEAWRQARRALRIDGENVAAARLVERLEEVWRHRGQPLPTEGAPDREPAGASHPAAAREAATTTAEPSPAAAVPEPAWSSPAPIAPAPPPDEHGRVAREPTAAERHAAELLAALGLGAEAAGAPIETAAAAPVVEAPASIDAYAPPAPAPAAGPAPRDESGDRAGPAAAADVPREPSADLPMEPADGPSEPRADLPSEPAAEVSPETPAAWPPPDRGVAPVVPRFAIVDRLLGRKRE